jgi:hypothetical protein
MEGGAAGLAAADERRGVEALARDFFAAGFREAVVFFRVLDPADFLFAVFLEAFLRAGMQPSWFVMRCHLPVPSAGRGDLAALRDPRPPRQPIMTYPRERM